MGRQGILAEAGLSVRHPLVQRVREFIWKDLARG